MLMTKDDKNVCFNSNRQNIQSDLSYNITTEIGATDTTGLRTEYMLLYLINIVLSHILFLFSYFMAGFANKDKLVFYLSFINIV